MKRSLNELRKDLSAAECVGRYGIGDAATRSKEDARKLRARIARRERDILLREMGMVKVRGALGGTYWE